MKKGFFIGSFNPPTKFHIEISKYLIKNKYLDKVVYVPINKNKKDLISGYHRLNMLNLAINNTKNIEIYNKFITDNNFNYYMLNILNNNIYFIIGSDILNIINTFIDYEKILNKHYFIVINRKPYNDLEIIKNKYLKYQDKFILINKKFDISSTMIRNNIKSLTEIESLTDKKVIDYIRKNHLYQNTCVDKETIN